ncbi:MAG: type II secretion system F family protein, partial [Planctomycetota bacterium]|nr:type II secretion system F family protein [Planctomycetota bacterium]
MLVFIAVVGLCVMTLGAMKTLWRAQVLRLLGAFMRRGLPLEPALSALGELGCGAGEEPLVRTLAFRLARGQNLAEALREMRVISGQQAVALSLAQEQGAAGGVLAELAARATRGERQALRVRALAVYPLLMGTVLLVNTLFILVFIAPKLEQMFKEM